MADEQLPPNAYGPINSGRPGNIDPFASFDNRIRYQDMLRYQMISQYAQNTITPQDLTPIQQRSMAHGEYQYGVYNDQSTRYYQRQAEMARIGRSAGIATGFANFAPSTAIDLMLLALKVPFVPAMAASLAIGAIPAHFIEKGIERTIERQKLMQSMSLDLDQYRSRLGFNSPLSYNESSMLAGRLVTGMDPGTGEGPLNGTGQFFNREQQMRIHKIAISNNMLNARGWGADAGTMKQYQQNFEDLKKTTEDVVKLLQTTIEGGMSVIKNLQNTGFRSLKDVRNQVLQAKAFGGITGMGAENMMMIGAAGAQAVQGTPYSAAVGANMYQQGAAQAALMAKASMGGQYVVDRAGGVAAAGGAIARFQMNMMSSGMGTKMTAYAMNPDGTINFDKLNKLTAGGVGAYEMVSGAGRLGYAMGPNRVLFEKRKEDFWNDPRIKGWQRDAAMMDLFKAWGSHKPGTEEAKAWVFAGLGTNDQRERRLVSDYLIGPKGYEIMNATANVEDAMIGLKRRPIQPYGLAGMIQKTYRGFVDAGEDMGVKMMSNANKLAQWTAESYGAGTFIDKSLLWGGKVLGIVDPYSASVFGRGDIGDIKTGLARAWGAETYGDLARGIKVIAEGNVAPSARRTGSRIKYLNTSKMSREDLETVLQATSAASFNQTLGELPFNKDVIRALGGEKSTAYAALKGNPSEFSISIFNQTGAERQKAKLELDNTMKEYNVQLDFSPGNLKKEQRIMENARRDGLLSGKYSDSITQLQRRVLEAEKAFKKYDDMPNYLVNAMQAGLTEKEVLKASARNMFYGKLPTRATAGWREHLPYSHAGANVGWNDELVQKIRSFGISVNPETGVGMDVLANRYAELSAISGKTGALKSDELRFMQLFKGKESIFTGIESARNQIAAKDTTVALEARGQAFIAAGDRRGIKMTDAFRRDYVDLLTGRGAFSQNRDIVGPQWAKENAWMLSQLSGATKGYFTQAKTWEGLVSNIVRDPGFAAGTESIEKERRGQMAQALNIAILQGKGAGDIRSQSIFTDALGKSIIDLDKVKDINVAAQALQRMDQTASSVTGDAGKGRYVNVNPPITNYWNNRWVL